MEQILKKKKQILSVVLILLMVCLSLFAVMSTTTVKAASGFEKIGDATDVPQVEPSVGLFNYNGQPAFCMQHQQGTPETGAEVFDTTYGNDTIRKILYYGYTGPGQWAGITDDTCGRVFTSLLLDKYYEGGSGLAYDWITEYHGANFNDFEAYVMSQPVPSATSVTFDKKQASVSWDSKNKVQISESISVIGEVGASLSFTVPEGATLIKSDGTKLTGSVTLSVGDQFHLEAPAQTVSGTWNSGDVGKSFKYQALVIKFGSPSLQHVGQGNTITDPAAQTSLTVNWMDFGRIDLKKYGEQSADGNFLNPLQGAEFTLTDKATGDVAATMTTDATGAALSEWLPIGRTYTVTETKTPAGYKAVIPFDVSVGEKDKTYYYDLLDRVFAAEVKIIKYDPNAEKPILKAGTIFKVKDAVGNYIKQRQQYPNDQMIDEFVTNDEGYLVMPEKLMSGNYVLEEVKAPVGYTLGKADIPFTVGPDTYKDGYVTVHYGNTPVTGRVKVIKKDNVTSQLLAGAEFTLTAAEDIVSPADGSMRYEKGAVVATQITGENGEALFDHLYLGQYILKETKAPVNYYQDDTKEYPINIEYKDQDTPVIEVNQDVENERGIIIGTQVTDKNTGTQEAIPGKQTTFVDTVKYEKLAVGSEYTVKGILMDKATGQPLVIDGKQVTAETTFTPEKSDGTVDVIFTFDASSLKGKEIVVFEDLFQGEDKVYTHADIKDKDQTIKFTESEIKTTAKDKASGKNEGTVNPTTTIVDTVQYTDLIVGQEYTMKGVLMDKSTGNPLIVNGQEIRAEKTFKPEKKDGTVELEFTFDSSALAGKEVVVFENLFHKDTEVAVHADINDLGQTVKFVELPSVPATGLDGSNTMLIVGVVLVIIAAGGATYYFVKKKKSKED